MKNNDGGSYGYSSDEDKEMMRWSDISVVTFRSNSVGIKPVREVKRNMKKKGSVMVSHQFFFTYGL